MYDLLLTGGSVLTVAGVESTNVAISDGRIAAIGTDTEVVRRTIDCSGSWVGPGFVDIHVHFRDPGQVWKEDIASGSATAVAGGFTGVVAMANTDPAVDSVDQVRYVRERGRDVGLLDVQSAGAITVGRLGEQLVDIRRLWDSGVRIFSDDGDSVAEDALLRAAMEQVADLGGVVSQHAVDGSLSAGGAIHEGEISATMGLSGIPRRADDITIARDIALARATGVRYHVQHLSTVGGVELVRSAKEEGLDVTAEASPHHLLLTHEDVRTADSNYKMMPPLRESQDRDALIAGLRSGVIDAVATDHAPHSIPEKSGPFEIAPNGVIGLEWAAAVTNQVVGMTQAHFFDRLSTRPARLGGFAEQGKPLDVGDPANIVVFDPRQTWTPVSTRSKSSNSPYWGRELTGRVTTTIYEGRVVHGDDL